MNDFVIQTIEFFVNFTKLDLFIVVAFLLLLWGIMSVFFQLKNLSNEVRELKIDTKNEVETLEKGMNKYDKNFETMGILLETLIDHFNSLNKKNLEQAKRIENLEKLIEEYQRSIISNLDSFTEVFEKNNHNILYYHTKIDDFFKEVEDAKKGILYINENVKNEISEIRELASFKNKFAENNRKLKHLSNLIEENIIKA